MTKDIGDRIFDVQATVNGSTQTVQIKLTETTDGVPYYICLLGEKEISQLRRELEGGWKQLWGNLDAQDVAAIGKAIDTH